jgi:hypothetical protein
MDAASRTGAGRTARTSRPGEQADQVEQERRPLWSNIAVGGVVSSLGIGVVVAVVAHPRANVRVGFNSFRHHETFDYHGIAYVGPLIAESIEARVDWFPFAGKFHVSPGVMLYDANRAEMRLSVPGGHTFEIGGSRYVSNRTKPIVGSARVSFNSPRPMLVFGWGHLIPAGNKRFGVAIEAGVVFQGAPNVSLNIEGSVCDRPDESNCVDVATDTGVQRDLASERVLLTNHESGHIYLRFYPVMSLAVSYKF